jgi:chitin synthase
MLDDDDKRSIHSLDSRRTQSIAGFSLATKKRGPYSYHGGADYYRDSNQSRMGSRSPTMNFPPPNGAPPSNYHGYQANGSPRGSQIGGNNGSISNGDYGHYPGQSGSPLAPSFGPLAPPPPLTQHQSNFSRSSMMSQQLPSMRPVSGMSMGNFASMNSMGGMSRPMSSYSLNPFGGNGAMSAAVISDSADPGDGDVIATLRSYLAHQDLVRSLSSCPSYTLNPPLESVIDDDLMMHLDDGH